MAEKSKKPATKNKGGRPRKEIDEKAFRNLCGLMCTLDEIAGFFECSQDTIERWCVRTYGESFADTFKKYSNAGKISLRRAQFRLAEKNAAMAIFLGKNYLGQTDSVETKVEFENDGFIEALKGQVQDTFKSAGDIVEE